jgi:hypothetical protein
MLPENEQAKVRTRFRKTRASPTHSLAHPFAIACWVLRWPVALGFLLGAPLALAAVNVEVDATTWVLFGTGAQQRQANTAAAILLHVAESAATQPVMEEVPEKALTPEREFAWRLWLSVIILGFVVLATLLLIARRIAPDVREVLAERRSERLDSEAHAFTRVEQACRNNNAMAAYEALLAWCLKCGWPSLASCVRTHPHPALAAQIERLEAALYSTQPESPWNGADLLAALRDARNGTRPSRSRAPALPPLNP